MNNMDSFRFSIEIQKSVNLSGSLELFREAISPFGFVTFGCGELDLREKDRNVFYLLDWPENWRRFYIEAGFINQDPLIEALEYRREPFTWTDLRADRKLAKAGRHAIDFARAEGWREGLVVPLQRTGNRVGLVSMVGHSVDISPSVVAYLSLISMCLHAHVRTLVANQGFAVPPVGLTPREIACLRLVAQGRSDAAIGERLGIARSTAHEYIESAKKRFKTRSRTELVAIAVALGIIAI